MDLHLKMPFENNKTMCNVINRLPALGDTFRNGLHFFGGNQSFPAKTNLLNYII